MRADSLSRDEEPLAHAGFTLRCAETASEREVLLFNALFAVLLRAPKLDPGISGPIRITVHEQIPFDSFGGIGVGFQTLRIDFAIQQERKLQCENTRLACAIVSAQ